MLQDANYYQAYWMPGGYAYQGSGSSSTLPFGIQPVLPQQMDGTNYGNTYGFQPPLPPNNPEDPPPPPPLASLDGGCNTGMTQYEGMVPTGASYDNMYPSFGNPAAAAQSTQWNWANLMEQHQYQQAALSRDPRLASKDQTQSRSSKLDPEDDYRKQVYDREAGPLGMQSTVYSSQLNQLGYGGSVEGSTGGLAGYHDSGPVVSAYPSSTGIGSISGSVNQSMAYGTGETPRSGPVPLFSKEIFPSQCGVGSTRSDAQFESRNMSSSSGLTGGLFSRTDPRDVNRTAGGRLQSVQSKFVSDVPPSALRDDNPISFGEFLRKPSIETSLTGSRNPQGKTKTIYDLHTYVEEPDRYDSSYVNQEPRDADSPGTAPVLQWVPVLKPSEDPKGCDETSSGAGGAAEGEHSTKDKASKKSSSARQQQPGVNVVNLDDTVDYQMCEMCDMRFESQKDYNRHSRGMIHCQKLLERETRAGLVKPDVPVAESGKPKNDSTEPPKPKKMKLVTRLDDLIANPITIVDKPVGKGRDKRIGQSYFCEVCKVPCQTEEVLQNHVEGKKHKKILRTRVNVVRMQRIMKGDRIKCIETGKPALIQQQLEMSQYAIIGAEYVVEYVTDVDNDAEARYICTLCETKCDPRTIIIHLTSHKHRFTYFKEVRTEYYGDLLSNREDKPTQMHLAEEYATMVAREAGTVGAVKQKMEAFEVEVEDEENDGTGGGSTVNPAMILSRQHYRRPVSPPRFMGNRDSSPSPSEGAARLRVDEGTSGYSDSGERSATDAGSKGLMSLMDISFDNVGRPHSNPSAHAEGSMKAPLKLGFESIRGPGPEVPPDLAGQFGVRQTEDPDSRSFGYLVNRALKYDQKYVVPFESTSPIKEQTREPLIRGEPSGTKVESLPQDNQETGGHKAGLLQQLVQRLECKGKTNEEMKQRLTSAMTKALKKYQEAKQHRATPSSSDVAPGLSVHGISGIGGSERDTPRVSGPDDASGGLTSRAAATVIADIDNDMMSAIAAAREELLEAERIAAGIPAQRDARPSLLSGIGDSESSMATPPSASRGFSRPRLGFGTSELER